MERQLNSLAATDPARPAIASRPQRRQFRQKICTLAYLHVDQGNGGIVRDISENGTAIQAVAALHVEQQVFLRFDLPNPRVRVEATGRVAWADPKGQAGIEFLALPQRCRRLLKEWIFIQLLTVAQHAAGDTIFAESKRDEEAPELRFSASPRPAIRLAPEEIVAAPEEGRAPAALQFPWCPFAMSPSVLSRLADGLILVSAVLLFCLMSIAMTQVFPAWPLALAIGTGVTVVFATLYWCLFVIWIGATPGDRLARSAVDGGPEDFSRDGDDRPRFR